MKLRYVGWIIADKEEKSFLESLGVKIIGGYNEEEHSFDECIVTEDVLQKLDPYWGRFYWGLFPNC